MRTISGRWLAALWIASALVTMAMLHHARENVSVRRPLAMLFVVAIVTTGWLRA